MSLYRIGVDVGGTNTDAAILDVKAVDAPGRGVLASHKATTSPDITTGIENAIRAVIEKSEAERNRVISVTIGTAHFINALVEADQRRLDRVAVVRLCGPFTQRLPPFSDFPHGIRNILEGPVFYVDGGFEFDGREIAPLNVDQIRKAARDIVAAGVKAVAVVGVFSPLDIDYTQERMAKELLIQGAPELQVVCSHNIGPSGFLERENATILNAAILRTGHKVTKSFKRAMARLRLSCPLYLSQNDGTLIDADTAADYPIKTFASGPTNSVTGAAFLAGLDHVKRVDESGDHDDTAEMPQVLVVDIGGTTTDVCALLPSGFPRQAPGFVEIAGIRTTFSMPQVVSIGLGGGSKVISSPTEDGKVAVGPASVGHYLQQQAKTFGGQTLTATDIIVALGKSQLGDANLLHDIPVSVIQGARLEMKRLLENVIEQMKVSPAPARVLLVGGGALLVTEDLNGVEKCIRPVHQGAANAVGAAISKVSGDVDCVEIPGTRSEREVVQSACQKAIDIVVKKGAARESAKIVEINKTPLQYMPNNAVRVQVRAVGQLSIPHDLSPPPSPPIIEELRREEDEGRKVSVPNALLPSTKPSLDIDLENYRPDVHDGVWYVSEIDLEMMSSGCGALGTGGGGPTHYEFLHAVKSLRKYGKGSLRVISATSLRDDDMATFGSWYGSPSVINERVGSGAEIPLGIAAVQKLQGIKSFAGIYTDEIGGGNGMSAFPPAAELNIPVIDGDAMGRAYPTMYHAPLSDEELEATDASSRDAYSNGLHMTIPFQNEYLYAALTDSNGSEEGQKIVCTVPDLISILGQDGEAIGSQDLRYGMRVNVIVLPAYPLWKTDQALKVGGPEGFGLNMPVVSVDIPYTKPRSVIEEFGGRS
ncbi:hypothetical protein DV737_g3390, partial [Chaetothyriales sp. CBS 132003]